MKIPFWFALTDADEYGTPFSAVDDAFGSTAELNGVLASIAAATQANSVYGLQLPPTTVAYRIKSIENLVADVVTDEIEFGIWNGAAFVKLYIFTNGGLPSGQNRVDFGDGLTVAAGYIPAFRLNGTSATTLSGLIEWVR